MDTPSAIEERAAERMSRHVAHVPVANLRAALRFAMRSLPPGSDRVPGTSLRLYRESSHVTAADVAAAMDLSKQMVSKMEDRGAAMVDAGKYRAAVDLVASTR